MSRHDLIAGIAIVSMGWFVAFLCVVLVAQCDAMVSRW